LLDFVVKDVPGFAREVLRSRLGLILFLVHLALVSCAFAAHFTADPAPTGSYDEPLVVQFVFFINLPAIFAASLPVFGFLKERTPEDYGLLQWASVSFVVLCALCQWWLYGYVLERLSGRER
jgi:hypothetical protein